MSHGPHVDKNGDVQLGALFKWIGFAGVVALLTGHGILYNDHYRLGKIEVAQVQSNKQAEVFDRNQRRIDEQARQNEAEVKWANRKLDKLLQKEGLTTPPRPDVEASTLEPVPPPD